MAPPSDRPDSALTDAMAEPQPEEAGCFIRALDEAAPGIEIELVEGTAIIGSRPGCDLQLADSTVSGEHLRVEVVSGGLQVSDLGSTNGTFYLDTRIEKAVLQPGATVRLGRARLALASRQQVAGPGFSERSSYGAILGSTPVMRRLFAMLEQLEGFESTTVILGATGVGKELVAHEVHNRSARAAASFVICDCAALTPTLVESELFGHERGAFTGAHARHIGVFERADGGTILLDEIGELPLETQPKLLRVLEGRTVRRVGGEADIPIDVRVIAATHRDLAIDVQEGRFREDLYYRLNHVTLQVPTLRQRREDIPTLISAFLAERGQRDDVMSASTRELFTTGYDWPGNVRELRHAVARVVAIGSVPEAIGKGSAGLEPADEAGDTSFREGKRRVVESFERDYLAAKLRDSDGNLSRAARAAGMERNHLKRLLRKYNLLPSDPEAA